MQKFEQDYRELILKVMIEGEARKTRNAETIAIFGSSLSFDLRTDGFPLLQGRKIFYKGVFGELAAMLRKPTHIDDFTKWGCNFWGQWAEDDGSINVDYGNAWFANHQIDKLKFMLANDPTNRRMMISGWRPDRLNNLSLPCCHYNYQFYVEQGNTLHMVWTQRSVDVMIGLPSDMVFAAAWLMAIANEFGFTAGSVKMDFGDTHIYTSHVTGVHDYLLQLLQANTIPVASVYLGAKGKDFCTFEPTDIEILHYNPQPTIRFELHG